MGVNKGFEEREAAEEKRFVHGEDQRHIEDIKEVGLDGAKVREKERQARAGIQPRSIAPDGVKENRGDGVGRGLAGDLPDGY